VPRETIGSRIAGAARATSDPETDAGRLEARERRPRAPHGVKGVGGTGNDTKPRRSLSCVAAANQGEYELRLVLVATYTAQADIKHAIFSARQMRDPVLTADSAVLFQTRRFACDTGR